MRVNLKCNNSIRPDWSDIYLIVHKNPNKHKFCISASVPCTSYFYRLEPAWLYAFLVIGNRYREHWYGLKKSVSNRMCLLRRKSLSLKRVRKGCGGKRGNPISHFDLSTLFGEYSVLGTRSRSAFKASRWGVGAQVQRARVHARTHNLFQRTRAGNTRAFVRRYHLWLWIVAVYKFGGTLTDYKYRLSR